MFNRNWLKRQFGQDVKNRVADRLRPTPTQSRKRLHIESLEPRLFLAADLGGDPSAVLPNDSTGFSQAPATGDFSAAIDLAQNSTQVTVVSVGAGEPSAQSTLRYVSTGGGAGVGSEADPWSLDYANHVVQAGETILMLAGTYDGIIDPKTSGTAGNPITYKPAPGADVHLRAIGSKYAVSLGEDYILVEGLTVSRRDGRDGETSHVTNVVIFSDHVTVRNLVVVNTGDHIEQARIFSESGIVARGMYGLVENNHVENMKFGIGLGTDRKGSFYNVIRGNTIADPVYDGIHIGNGNGAPLHHLVENNIIFGAMVSDGITFDGRNSSNPADHLGINQVIVRNNAIFNSGENNIDLKSTTNIVIEGNFLWKGFGDNDGSNVLDIHNGPGQSNTSLINDEGGGSGITKGSGTISKHVIIRNNVMIDNNQAGPVLERYKVYNNTLLNNRRNYNGPNQPMALPDARKPGDSALKGNGTGPDGAILNNIIGDHGSEVVLQTLGGAAIDGNAYYNTFQSPRFSAFADNYDWTTESFVAWQTWLQSKNNFTGNEANSQVVANGAASLFVGVPAQPTGDPAQFDFRLTANSPAIDAGVFLTETVGSGSGTTMMVADAELFFDGYGITLGDEIQVEGQTARARITSISGNTLTLDQPLTWANGVGVSMAYLGNRPDVGAIEFEGPIPLSANADSVTTLFNTPITTPNLLANDSFPVGGTPSIQSFTLPAHGSVTDHGNGTLTYTPSNGFHGTDSLTYTLQDGLGETETGTLSITVNAEVPAGLVGYWSLDADDIIGTTVLDGSGHYHDGTIQGSPAPLVGEIGGALGFQQGDQITIDDDDLFDVSHITIAAWINPEGNVRQDLVSKNQGSSYDLETESGGRLRFNANFGTGLISHRSAHGSYVAGEWQHVAVTYDGSHVAFYVDGVAVGSNVQVGPIQSDTRDIKIGNSQLLGEIDEVRIYDHALTQPEVAALAAPGLTADFDADGDVDGADFLNWQRGFGTSYNAGHLVDWQSHYLAGGSAIAALSTARTDTPKKDLVFAESALPDDEVLPEAESSLHWLALNFSAEMGDRSGKVETEVDLAIPVARTSQFLDFHQIFPREKSQLVAATPLAEERLAAETSQDESVDLAFDFFGSKIEQ